MRRLFKVGLIWLLLLVMVAGCRQKPPVQETSITNFELDSQTETSGTESSEAFQEVSFILDEDSGEEPAAESKTPSESAAPVESREESVPEADAEQSVPAESSQEESAAPTLDENGRYYFKDDVALYLHLYGHLPSNYLTNSEAQARGWISSRGNLWKVTDKMCIGGDYFGNYEKRLPTKKGRKYYECDVNYNGGYRGDDRIIYSNDGLIYFTSDHYTTFELLYGDKK